MATFNGISINLMIKSSSEIFEKCIECANKIKKDFEFKKIEIDEEHVSFKESGLNSDCKFIEIEVSPEFLYCNVFKNSDNDSEFSKTLQALFLDILSNQEIVIVSFWSSDFVDFEKDNTNKFNIVSEFVTVRDNDLFYDALLSEQKLHFAFMKNNLSYLIRIDNISEGAIGFAIAMQSSINVKDVEELCGQIITLDDTNIKIMNHFLKNKLQGIKFMSEVDDNE